MKYELIGIITSISVDTGKFHPEKARIEGLASVENKSKAVDFNLPIDYYSVSSEMNGKQVKITVEITE